MGFMIRGEFDTVMNWALSYYEAGITKTKADVWFDLFKGISKEEFKTAFLHVMKTDTYGNFPAAGKITAALDELEERRINKAAERPNFTTLWMRTVAYFPGKQDYAHFPPESDETAWNGIYDRIHAVPIRDRAAVVSQIIQELESK